LRQKQLKKKDKIEAIKSIKDINDHFDYTDDHPNGKYDGKRVACGQKGKYNELEYIYDTYLKVKVESKEFSKEKAIKALASACFNLDTPRDREDFYIYLESTLGCDTIFPEKLK
jgi:hypothetical protein